MRSLLWIFLMCGAACPLLRGQNFVNGNFQTPTGFGCDAGAAWATSTGANAPQYTNCCNGTPANYWIDLTPCFAWGNGSWVEQTLVLNVGTTYTVSLDLGSFCGWDLSDAGVYILVNGVQIGSRLVNDSFICNQPGLPMYWKNVTSAPFTATVASNTIRIVGEGRCTAASPTSGTYACTPVGGLGYPGVIGIDNVQLNVAAPPCLVNIANANVQNVACHGGNTGSIDLTLNIGTIPCASTTVALNEIMYRPSLNNGVDPNTGEWIELIGPPGANIGCYVLTDGDWTVTIPPGTTIPADGIFTIGNNIVYGPGFFDLDAESCGCFNEGFGGNALLILTDGGEYVAMFNGAGSFVQGLMFGTPTAGNTPPSGGLGGPPTPTVALPGCPASVAIPGAASFQTHPGGVAANVSLARVPDGNGAWTTAAGGGSPNACNAGPVPAPHTIQWSNGATTEDISGLAAGTYTVTITDINGCSVTQSYTVTQPLAPLSTSAIVGQVTCNGANNGAIDLSVSGGTPGYTYNWGGGITTQDRTGLAPGNYTVTVTDNNGCTTTRTETVTQPAALTTSAILTQVNCNGANTGAIDLSVLGGTPGYTYNWGGGITSQDRTGLPAGTYTVTVTDNNGCTTTRTETITQPTALALGATPTHLLCAGINTGAVNLTVNGGTPGYGFAWSNGASSQNLSALAAGSYTVTVTDNNGCTSTAATTVNTPAALTIILDAIADAGCNGGSNGSIDISVSGGTGAYAYNWGGGISTQDRNNLPAGTYTVTVSDANNCTASQAFAINEGGTVVLTADFDPIACHGAPTCAWVTATGGSGNYGYAWSGLPAMNNDTLCLLAAGNYSVTVTDTLGGGVVCASVALLSVSQPDLLDASSSVVDNLCAGDNAGSIDITVGGGTGTYSYLWSNGATSQDLNALPGGNYSVTVSDANGCSLSISALVDEPAALSLTLNALSATCGADQGSINLSVSGGTGAYAYLWSNGSTAQNLGNLPSGNYSVTVSDANGCVSVQNAALDNGTPLTATIKEKTILCAGDPSGAVVFVNSGTSPYTYLWNNGSTGMSIENQPIGTYTTTVTDAAGCSIVLSITPPPPPPLTPIIVNLNQGTCAGGPASVSVSATGGTGMPVGFTYEWSNGATGPNLSGLMTSGDYTLTVTDYNDCTATITVTIAIPGPISVEGFINAPGQNQHTVLLGETANIGVVNPVPGFVYQWSIQPTGISIVSDTSVNTTAKGDALGVYNLTVTAISPEGCTAANTVQFIVTTNFMGMPTAFTPNGDGENDRFRPVNLDPSLIQSFMIFNRFGQKVYDNALLSDGGWDGTLGGQPQARDAYLFVLTYQLPGQEPITLRGEAMLLR